LKAKHHGSKTNKIERKNEEESKKKKEATNKEEIIRNEWEGKR